MQHYLKELLKDFAAKTSAQRRDALALYLKNKFKEELKTLQTVSEFREFKDLLNKAFELTNSHIGWSTAYRIQERQRKILTAREKLPWEAVFYILQHLAPVDLLRMRQVDRYYRDTINQAFWQWLFQRTYKFSGKYQDRRDFFKAWRNLLGDNAPPAAEQLLPAMTIKDQAKVAVLLQDPALQDYLKYAYKILFFAIKQGNIAVTDYLLKNLRFYHPDLERICKIAALYIAKLYKKADVAELLIKHYGVTDFNTIHLETKLLLAAVTGEIAILEDVINKEVDLDITSYNDWTASHLAAIFGQSLAMEILIQQGAKTDQCDQIGLAPFDYFVKDIHAIAKLLKEEKSFTVLLSHLLLKSCKDHLTKYQAKCKLSETDFQQQFFANMQTGLTELIGSPPAPKVALAVYQLIATISNDAKTPQEKLTAITDFEKQMQPWWKTLGKVFSGILIAAAGIAFGAAIGVAMVLAGAWLLGTGLTLASIISLFSTMTVSNLTVSLTAGAGLTGVSTGTLSTFWLFKSTPAQRMAKAGKTFVQTEIAKLPIIENKAVIPLDDKSQLLPPVVTC